MNILQYVFYIKMLKSILEVILNKTYGFYIQLTRLL